MNVRKVKEIVKFDLEKSIQNKWFVILNVVMLLGILVATNWTHIKNYMKENNINIIPSEEMTIEVIDKENIFYDDFAKMLKDHDNFKLSRVEENKYSKDNLPEKEYVLIEVSTDTKNIVTAKIISRESISVDIYNLVYESLKETRSKVFAKNNGITIEELNILNEPVEIEEITLGVNVENAEQKEMIKMFSVIIVYAVLIMVLSRITNEIAQEKVSKSIEYVLTSVSEKEYLLAKVLGGTLTILVQLLYTFVYYIIGNMISVLIATGGGADISQAITASGTGISTDIISYVLVMCAYLIFTVFLTTLIQAAFASKTTSVAEAGNTMMLLMFVIIALYIISLSAISPYTKVSAFMYIVSCIPIISTFFVPAMMIIGQATTLQVIISFVLLIACVPFIFKICAKIFKNGILDYNTKTKKKSLFGKKKEEKELDIREKQDIEIRKVKASKYAFAIGMSMIIFVFLSTVLSFGLTLLLPSILKGVKIPYVSYMVLQNAVILIISISASMGFIKLYTDEKFESSKKKLTNFQRIEIVFIGIAFLTAIQLLLGYIYPKVGLDNSIFEEFSIIPGNSFGGKLLYIVCMSVVPAIFEEILFRGWILQTSKKYGKVFAVVFSSLLFGLYHMNLNQGIFAFLIGLVFGTIAIYAGGIRYTVLLHFLNNFYACLTEMLGKVPMDFINVVIIGCAIIGGLLILKNLPKVKEIKKEELSSNGDYKYLLRNYTFIISMVLMVVLMVATQNLISN